MKLEDNLLSSPNLGIMQGRLIDPPGNQLDWFPKDNWRDEFFLAKESNLDFIELVAEKVYNKENPIWSLEGRNEILGLIEENNLNSSYLCFNYMMNNSILEISAISQLTNIFEICSQLKIKNIVLPFFDKSEILEKNIEENIKRLNSIAHTASINKITLHLETNLSGSKLLSLVKNINYKNTYILVDTGNYFNNNFDIISDIKLFKNFIGHIHIKDKDIIGNNVLLGSGGVDFLSVFKALNQISYSGNYTFETTRGSKALLTSKFNRTFFEYYYSNI